MPADDKKKRRASIATAKSLAEKEAEAEEEHEDDDAEKDDRPGLDKADSGSKKGGSMFNLFKRSGSKDSDAALAGTLHYKTVAAPRPRYGTPRGEERSALGGRSSDAERERRRRSNGTRAAARAQVVKSMFGGAKAVWKKRKMELVLVSDDEVGPVLCWRGKKAAGADANSFRIVLEGVFVADADDKPTKKAQAFALMHPTYAEPKVFYADSVEERAKWTDAIKAAIADYKDALAKQAESSPEEVAKKTEVIKKARRASITIEESVAHFDDDDDTEKAAGLD